MGYKHATATPFYHRLNSLVAFGLVEGRGNFRITALGQKILFPESTEDDEINKSKSILKVPLWKELYGIHKKQLPVDKLWVDLKNIANVDPDVATKSEETIRKYYNEDISYLSEDVTSINGRQDTETLRSSSTKNKQERKSRRGNNIF